MKGGRKGGERPFSTKGASIYLLERPNKEKIDNSSFVLIYGTQEAFPENNVYSQEYISSKKT